MLLNPRNFKYRKQQKGRSFNKIIGSSSENRIPLKFGSVGLKALSSGRVTAKQINSVRQAINKQIKKLGRLKVNVFPHIPITKKPIEVRMGKGKGAVDHWVAVVRPGTIIYEIGEAKENLAKVALMSGAKQLSMRCNFVKRS